MKNFDIDRNNGQRKSDDDRTFVLAGHTLVVRDRVRPEALIPLDTLKDPKVDYTLCTCTHKLNHHATGPCTFSGCDCQKMNPVILEPGSSLSETLAAIDSVMGAYIDPAYQGAYAKLREQDDDPVSVGDLMGVIKWMTEDATAHPTGLPGVSSPGPLSTGPSSTESSSSPDTAAA